MGKLIALYKAFRGGEFFRASLDSVRPFTEGAVVVFSDAPWLHGLSLPENCSEPLREFTTSWPDYPVQVRRGVFRQQERQWNVGLDAIREHFGEDSAVLIVDTDETWPASCLASLRRAIESQPATAAFYSGIRTYLRSPLYCVWPPERGPCLVALQNTRHPCRKGRWQLVRGPRVHLPIYFDHWCYVRSDPAEITEKFLNTSSQEETPSNVRWLDNVWPQLPLGQNLHMTPGCEHVWPSIKIFPPQALPGAVRSLAVTREQIAEEDLRWRERLQRTRVQDQLLPCPTWDAQLYDEDLRHLIGHPSLLLDKMQTSCLESLCLAYWASQVPAGGRILEIGCGHGGSTTALAVASPGGVIIDTVDPFEPYTETAAGGTIEGVMEGNEKDFWNTLCHYKVDHKIRHLKSDSREVGRLLDLGGYDLVFVDGNHSYGIAKQDIELTRPMIKPGGRLVAHDYTTRFPGVIAAVEQVFGERGRVAAGTSLFYVVRDREETSL